MLAVNEVETYGEAVGPGVAWVPQGNKQCTHGRSFGGTGHMGHEGEESLCTFPWGGTSEIELLCRCWRWARPGAAGPEARDRPQMVTFLSGRARHWEASTAVPISRSSGSLGEPSERKGWCPRPHLTHQGSFLPAPEVGVVHVHMCQRGMT